MVQYSRLMVSWLVAGLLTAIVSLTPAFGQDGQSLAQLQAEIHELRMRLDQAERWSSGPCHSSCGCEEGCGASVWTPTASGPSIEAGYAFVFAKPHMKESFELTSTDVLTGTMSLSPFRFDYDNTPRVWLHLSSEAGPGLRARYWRYDHGAHPRMETAGPTTFPGASAVTVIFPAAISTMAPGDILNSATSLDVQTLDLEGTMPVRWNTIEVLGNAGLRYASMDQQSRAAVVSGGAVTQALAWERKFEGLGPSVGADVRAPLGIAGLSMVSNLRGSLLFGEKTLTRRVLGDVTPPPATTPPIISLDDADEVTGIFELALGVEYSRKVAQDTSLFLRGMYEGQLWTSAGSPTLTFLGFEGFSIALGISR